MKRINDVIKIKYIQLENVKVKFQIKLLQYNLNGIIYKYNNKYAFKEYINNFINELINAVVKSNLKDDEEAKEIITRTKELICILRKYNETPSDVAGAVDNTLKYILFQYSKNKAQMTLYELIDMLDELKTIKSIIRNNKLDDTPRTENSYKLINQIQQRIYEIICDQ